MWEQDVNIFDVCEIRVKTNVYFGVGAISKINEIAADLKLKGIDKVVVVTGRGAYKITGAWDYVEAALKQHGIAYVNYDKVSPNPTTHQVDEATNMAKDFGAKAVIAIGGGSAIDTGKSVAILCEYKDKNATDLYTFKFSPNKALPIVAINLTHGTGTEANRFAVVTIPENEYKPAIAYDCIYPSYSINDPQMCIKLSPKQTLYVSIDAINHVVEASTSKVNSPFAVTLAKETVDLVSKYLPVALREPENLEARYYLMYASMIAGVCFDNGLLHYTHALEHPLSAVKPDLSHGFGLAMILPAVVEQIYAEKGKILAYIFSSIIPDLKGDASEAQDCAKKLEDWLKDMGITEKLAQEGFTHNDVQKLTDLAFDTPSLGMLLNLAPNEATKQRVQKIYEQSMEFYAFKS